MFNIIPTYEVIAKRIAGEIVLSDDPGLTMRKWRTLFELNQSEIAEVLELSPSVISDYETGRRKSPGSNFIKRYVESLVDLDHRTGGSYLRQVSRITFEQTDIFIDMREFSQPVSINQLITKVKGYVVTGEEFLNKDFFGYTIVDSLKAIQMLSGLEFYRIFGATSERALIFTNVSRGRSPMIALKISPFKPRIVILHGLKKDIDPLAKNLAETEGIPLVISRISSEEELVEALIQLCKKKG